MGGVLAVLMKHNNVGNGKAMPLEVGGAVDIKLFPNAAKRHILCKRCGIDEFIICPVNEMPRCYTILSIGGSAPLRPGSIEFEPMDANMDGYFSSDQQRIAIREGMSEVQTVSAAVHETAHSKLHDPKRAEPEPTWKVVMVSGRRGPSGTFPRSLPPEAEAEQFAADADWRFVDEISSSGGWRWRRSLCRGSRQRRTGILRKSRRYTHILIMLIF